MKYLSNLKKGIQFIPDALIFSILTVQYLSC